MKPNEIFDRLEQGGIDVAQSLELLRSVSPTGQTAPVDSAARSSSGRVLLRELGAGSQRAAAPEAGSRVRLSPLRPGSAPSTLSPAALSTDGGDGAVRLFGPEPGIAVIALEDEQGQNALGPRLGAGLERAAEQIRRDSSVRVVVVHGFETWFCTGGSAAALAAIRSGQASFTDFTGFRLLLDLEVPTIAAMQGHAFGGGLAFGLYADLVVVAEESYYAGNFMEHGLTPGMGATLLLPLKLGEVLGTEMLFTAGRYSGRELVERGAPLIATPRARVVARALDLARGMAQRPPQQLRLLKRHLAAKIRRALPEAIEAELAMHRELFGTGDR